MLKRKNSEILPILKFCSQKNATLLTAYPARWTGLVWSCTVGALEVLLAECFSFRRTTPLPALRICKNSLQVVA